MRQNVHDVGSKLRTFFLKFNLKVSRENLLSRFTGGCILKTPAGKTTLNLCGLDKDGVVGLRMEVWCQ